MNVLIVQDLFDGYGVRMLALVEGAQCLAQAKWFFDQDVAYAMQNDGIDEYNTWWDPDGYGQVVRANGCLTTYHVNYTSKLPAAPVANTSEP